MPDQPQMSTQVTCKRIQVLLHCKCGAACKLNDTTMTHTEVTSQVWHCRAVLQQQDEEDVDEGADLTDIAQQEILCPVCRRMVNVLLHINLMTLQWTLKGWIDSCDTAGLHCTNRMRRNLMRVLT